MNFSASRLSLLGAAVLGLGAAHAQCTRDIECKGDRICEAGVCTAPAPTGRFPGTTRGAQPASAAAVFEEQLRCDSEPTPAATLRALRTQGYIGLKPKRSSDGMMFFDVAKPMSVFGYPVVEVSGWEAVRDDTLFWRGPGTSPPLHVMAVVKGELATVKADLKNRIGAGPSVYPASFPGYRFPAAEITCFAR